MVKKAKGGRVKKQVGGVVPGVGAAGVQRPLAAGAASPLGAAGAAGVQRPLGGGVLPGARMVKKGGAVKKAKGGKVAKKQHGGMASQGYNARLDESLGARHPGATGSMAGRRAMSEGMERSMGRGPYSGARTMAKRGGTIKKKKK